MNKNRIEGRRRLVSWLHTAKLFGSSAEVNAIVVQGSTVFLPGEASERGVDRFKSTLKINAFAAGMRQVVLTGESAESIVVVSESVSSRRPLGVGEDGTTEKTVKGVPQGGPLSPLMANIMLDPLDKKIEAMGLPFARYADDFLVVTRSKTRALEVMEEVREYVEGRLKLLVNQDKSKVAPLGDGRVNAPVYPIVAFRLACEPQQVECFLFQGAWFVFNHRKLKSHRSRVVVVLALFCGFCEFCGSLIFSLHRRALARR